MIDTIRQKLFELQDLKYQQFQIKLTPGQTEEQLIGVRMPELRALAKELKKEPRIGEFLAVLPHPYFEEIMLHGMLIGEEKDYDRAVAEVDRLLPYIDNWATCDTLKMKAFKPRKNHERLLQDIQRWMASNEPYTIRYGMEMLMNHFLDEDFEPEQLQWVARIRYDHYYVRMMQAWYFATALAKQWEATIPYIEQPTMETWTHNKTIQKAIESFRITPEQKEYLRGLKRV